MKKKVDFPLVEVEWIDSSSDPGWKEDGSISVIPLTCWSAGYLVHKDKISHVIALSASSTGSRNVCGDTITIPTKCVVKMRKLK